MRIARLKESIQDVKKSLLKKIKPFVKHQKNRRLEKLEKCLEDLEQDRKEDKIRLCFGSKKLFHSQFFLEENGYTSHEEWKNAWEAFRSSEFFCIGSHEETAGNQSCALSIEKINIKMVV